MPVKTKQQSLLKVSRGQLARVVSQTAKVVNGSARIPIIESLRMVNESHRLTVTATDLDIEIAASMDSDGPDCAFCVDAKLFSGIVSKAGSEEITIESLAGSIVVKSGRSRFTLQTLPVQDFPTMDGGTFDAEFTADLASLVAPLQFAISTEETRYYLNGVYLEPTAATATDGHRLATVAWEAPALRNWKPVIIPRKTVGLAPKGEIGVAVSANRIRFTADDMVLTSKLIDGTFPDYRRVIPANNDKLVTVDRADFASAAARVATVSDDRGRAVKLDVAGDGIDLSVRGDAEATDSVEAQYSGEPVSIGFNSKYLQDVLSVMPNGPVSMALADGGAPALFTSATHEGLRIVLMPMRVN